MVRQKSSFDSLIGIGKRNRLGNDVKKPLAVLNYNKAKKGVDFSDQMSSYYTCLRKTIKWYKKVFFEILFGAGIVNAWLIHSKVSGSKTNMLSFRERVIAGSMKEASTEEQPNAISATRGI